MAIRQRKYNLFVRPFIKTKYGGTDVSIFAEDETIIYVDNPNPPSGATGCTHIKLNKTEETSYWTLYFSSNSYEQVRTKYRELLEEIGDDNIYMSHTAPFDIIATPRK